MTAGGCGSSGVEGVRESEGVCVPSLGDSSNLGHGSSKAGKGSGHPHRSGVGHGSPVTFLT
ncbi:hypothetical protein E2C01_090351 [Portunus trituberculatus]|uniref:Uncharacterized protein n=1 Tax=Portunus trituberculatus TaxID=210409 RepID=A0A5B7JL50_PORTR|nr:hypothetical protein [Portunus trituberculatus]